MDPFAANGPHRDDLCYSLRHRNDASIWRRFDREHISISALWHGRKTPGGFPGYDVAKLGVIRLTTWVAKDAANDGIRVNCLAPGWIATDGPRQYWESLTPVQRAERGVPSKLLSTKEIADVVVRLATDRSLNGRVVVWWSEDLPRLIEWGDRGYRNVAELSLS